MLQMEIDANIRTTYGKGAARVLRSKGMTPAVLYGAGVEPVSIELETKSFTKTLLEINRRNALINLAVGDGKKKTTRHVIIKELQTDPIRDTLLHADFCEVSVDAPMVLDVQVEVVGKAKGIDMGGVLQHGIDKVRMRGKILDFPDFLKIDISNLGMDEGLKVKDIEIPAELEVLDDENSTVVQILDPSKVKGAAVAEEAEEAGEEAAAAEAGEAEAAGGEEAAE